MRLIVILIVVAVVGWLAATMLKSQTDAVGTAARKAGVAVPSASAPREQVEAVGRAIDKMQADQDAQRRRQLDTAEKGE